MAANGPLIIGTRGSPLALYQAEAVKARLAAADPYLAAPDAMRLEIVTTTGDKVQDRRLAELGGKGLFTKELDEALLDGRIDLAVHSMKDLETRLASGVALAGMLERADPADAIICRDASGLDDLPRGAVIGTASVRRQAQLLERRPDLVIKLIRGNVQTRLGKLADGLYDATLLAVAGLSRLGMAGEITEVLAADVMLPAVGQGAIGFTCRGGDAPTLASLAAIDHAPTTLRVGAERAMLDVLDGSCRTPIAGLAEFDDAGGLQLRALVASPDGRRVLRTSRHGAAADAIAMGADTGAELRRMGGAELLDL